MNRHHYLMNGTVVAAEPRYQRQDEQQRVIVDQALRVQQSSNTMAAIEYLKAHDVDATVIERVLLEPHRRRR